MTEYPDEAPLPSPEWWVKLLDHGVPSFILVSVTLFSALFLWKLRDHFISLITAKRVNVETMTTVIAVLKDELPEIRKGVHRLADEASGTLRKVHEDVKFIRGVVTKD